MATWVCPVCRIRYVTNGKRPFCCAHVASIPMVAYGWTCEGYRLIVEDWP